MKKSLSIYGSKNPPPFGSLSARDCQPIERHGLPALVIRGDPLVERVGVGEAAFVGYLGRVGLVVLPFPAPVDLHGMADAAEPARQTLPQRVAAPDG